MMKKINRRREGGGHRSMSTPKICHWRQATWNKCVLKPVLLPSPYLKMTNCSAFFVKKYLPVITKYLPLLTLGKFPKLPYFLSFTVKFQTFHNIVFLICWYAVPAPSGAKKTRQKKFF